MTPIRLLLRGALGLLLAATGAAQTVPDFDAEPTSGPQALAVQFENLTTSDSFAVLYTWDFGDGSPTSFDEHPLHLYTEPGAYTVSLEALPLVPLGQDPVSITKVDFIEVTAGTLGVDFDATPTTGLLPLDVQFIARLGGTAGVTGLVWDFGDGAGSTETDPTHTYTTPGPHTVTLTATAGSLAVSETKPDLVQPSAPELHASFTVSGSPAPAGTPLQFTDTSTGDAPPTSWLWDFGDGSTSTLADPTHAYAQAGSYGVTLTVGLLSFSDTVTLPNAVRILVPDLQAAFTATPSEGYAPLLVLLEDASPTPALEWFWKIGDDDPSHVSTPTLETTFWVPGTYEVKFTIRVGDESDVTTGSVTVLDPQLQAGLEFFPRAGLAPLTVDFVDTSAGLGEYLSLVEFGDGAGSAQADGDHEYAFDGWYSPSQDVQTDPFSPLYHDALDFENAIEVVDPASVLALPAFGPAQRVYADSAFLIQTADLDGDGLPDLVRQTSSSVTVALQQGGVFGDPVAYPLDGSADVHLADLDLDGDLDLLAAYRDDPALEVWFGDGAGAFVPGTTKPLDPDDRIDWSVLVDADEDGALDVALGIDPDQAFDPVLRIAYGNGAGGFGAVSAPGTPFVFTQRPHVADVNDDGHLDLLGPAGQSGAFAVRFAYGDGQGFGFPFTVPGGLGAGARIDVGDVSGDGIADVVAVKGEAVNVLHGSRAGPQPGVPAGVSPGLQSVRLRDLDGDGDPDLLGHTSQSQLVLGRLGDGGAYDLWSMARLEADESPGDARWCDMDADGDPDVLVPTATSLVLHDNLGVRGRWADVGGAMSGASGTLQLHGAGELRPGAPVSFTLTGAAPLSPAFFVIGLSDLLAPFKGGVLVPNPDAVLAGLVTDAGGAFQLDAVWPGNVPAGAPSWYQVWVAEGGVLVGSNGVLAVAVD